jgi:hypothetical protein
MSYNAAQQQRRNIGAGAARKLTGSQPALFMKHDTYHFFPQPPWMG